MENNNYSSKNKKTNINVSNKKKLTNKIKKRNVRKEFEYYEYNNAINYTNGYDKE